MIDRLRLTAGAKQQLITLKRRTGLEHYNVICRHALCASLANPAPAPDEHLQFANGLEIEAAYFGVYAEESAAYPTKIPGTALPLNFVRFSLGIREYARQPNGRM